MRPDLDDAHVFIKSVCFAPLFSREDEGRVENGDRPLKNKPPQTKDGTAKDEELEGMGVRLEVRV